MDILIVGGVNSFGTNFTQLVLDKYPNYNVVCIDALNNFGYQKNVDCFSDYSRFCFYRVDTTDYSEILKLFKFWYGFDVVLNFESSSMSAYNILEIVKKYKTKKYVQIVSESHSSNRSSDVIAMSYCTSFGLPVVVLKYSSNYGIFQHPKRFIPSMITNVLERKPFVIESDLYCGINILDLCRALETLMHYGKNGEVYYIGGDECIKSIEIGSFIVNYLGAPESLLEKAGANTEQKINHIYTGYEKLNKEYGWHPVIDFKTGLIDVIEWYKDNEAWWQFLKTYI